MAVMTKKERKEFEKLTPWQQLISAWQSAQKRKKAMKKAKTDEEKIKVLYTKY